MKKHIVSVLLASLAFAVAAHAATKKEDDVKVEKFQSVAVMPPSDGKFAAVTPQGDGRSVAYEREFKGTTDRISVIVLDGDRVVNVRARFGGVWRDAQLTSDKEDWIVSSPDGRTLYLVDGLLWGKFFREQRASKAKK